MQTIGISVSLLHRFKMLFVSQNEGASTFGVLK
jgi:hypothetical protein